MRRINGVVQYSDFKILKRKTSRLARLMDADSMQSQRYNFKAASKCGMRPLRPILSLVFALWVAHFIPAVAQGVPPQDCSKIANPQDRQQCEERFSQSVNASSRTAELEGGWRLVRTPDPQGGSEAISIMHVSD